MAAPDLQLSVVVTEAEEWAGTKLYLVDDTLDPSWALLVEVSPAGTVTSIVTLAGQSSVYARFGIVESRVSLSEDMSQSDREEIARIARRELKGEKIDERILRGVKNALTSLFQTMYTRRSFWRNEISVDHQA